MIIFGIDHGTKSGYAVIDTVNHTMITGNFRVVGNTDGSRFNCFKQNLNELIHKYKPDVICSERPMDKMNGRTTTFLIGLYSMVHLIAFENSIDIAEMFPTSVKKLITGSGKSDKIDVARTLAFNYNVPLESVAIPIRYKRTAFNKRLNRTVNKGEIRDYEFDPSDALALCEAYRLKNIHLIERIDHENNNN